MGVILTPAIVDVNSTNINIAGSLGFFYTFKSKWGVTGHYRYSYLDNPKGSGQDGEPYGTVDSRGVPLAYKKASQIEIVVKSAFLSWEKSSKYHIQLGIAGPRTIAVGRVEGNIVRALTGRLGYQMDNRIIESETGIPYATNQPIYNYHHEGNVYPLERTFLTNSATMMQSNVVVAGIGYSSFRDIKLDIDDERYNGRREEKAQTDLFLDVLYAHNLKLQDMIYYHSLYPYTDEYNKLPERLDLTPTKLNKVGARLGFQSLVMYSPWFGTKYVVETGLRPGPKFDNFTGNAYFQITIGFIFGGRMALDAE